MDQDCSIRVLIDYRDPILRAGVAAVLQPCGRFEVLTRPGPSALASSADQDYGSRPILVADYETAMRQVDATSARYRILILTHLDSETHIRSAIERGIRGYLLLGCQAEALIAAVLALHRGTTAFSPLVAARMAESLSHEVLTQRELAVLRLMMLGLRDKAIGRELAIAVGTVKTHVKGIFGKLGAGARTEAVAIARRRGLLPDGGATIGDLSTGEHSWPLPQLSGLSSPSFAGARQR